MHAIKQHTEERKLPIIADSMVDPSFGTGAVKITPAHDANDFECGKRHNLPFLTVIDDKGFINSEGGSYAVSALRSFWSPRLTSRRYAFIPQSTIAIRA